MISYKKDNKGNEINLLYLETLINSLQPSWITKAMERTNSYRLAGKVTDSSHIWSEIKEVFMKLQGNKCAFCESELEGKSSGKGVHDIEHFRPKNRITKWKPSAEFNALGIQITDPGITKGYHLLTYNLLNYSIACGPCNQALKKDRFPIKGMYNTLMENPFDESNDEVPLLIFPIGDVDDDCETQISFEGPVPIVVKQQGLDFERAITTIEFFELGRADKRGRLFLERCEKILIIASFKGTDNDSSEYEAILKNLLSDRSKHANCGRAYIKLLEDNPNKAKEVLKEAKSFVLTYIPDGEID